MTAPSHSTRSTPTGYKMPEGFKSVLSIAGKTSIQLWERDIKPPGVDGGDAIDTTTQFNVSYHTFFPRKLKKIDPITFVAAYDPDVFADILGNVNVNQSMTFYFPDGSYVDFWGAMTKWEPGELKIGEFPTATVTIVVTNTDSSYGEVGPVFSAAPGT